MITMDGYGYGMYEDSPNAGIMDDSDFPPKRLEPETKQKKKEKFCTTCGYKLTTPYQYCSKCGKKVVKRKKENQCSCGVIFEPDEKYCFSCGKLLQNK